jgi:prevent-host-death family protein
MCYHVTSLGERRIGIRELKSKLSECVREVRDGQTIVVTERGRAVARLIPDTTSVRDRLAALKNAGSILWSGRRLGRPKPSARLRGRRTVADLVSENRE